MTDKKRPPKKNPVSVKLPDLQALRNELDDLKKSVRKHKEILQVNDGWHSRIAKMINKQVLVGLEGDRSIHGVLLYADRYTIGLRTADASEGAGEERIYNKGKIEYITLA